MKNNNKNIIKYTLTIIVNILLFITVVSNCSEVVANTDLITDDTNNVKIKKEIVKKEYKPISKYVNVNDIITNKPKTVTKTPEVKELVTKRNSISYDIYDMTVVSNMSANAVSKILEGTKFQYLASWLVQCEEKYNVNLLYVISIAAIESGWGTSNRARTQNNLTGIAVYNDYSSGTSFSSWEACIEETFRLLSEDYLNPEGRYYSGKSIWNVNTKYCTTPSWADKIISIMSNFRL